MTVSSSTYQGHRIVPKWTADYRGVRHYVIMDRLGGYVAMAPDEATAKRVIDRNLTSRHPSRG